MFNELTQVRPYLPAFAVATSGGVGVTLWLEKATGVAGFLTAVVALLTALLGFAYWAIKTWRLARKRDG